MIGLDTNVLLRYFTQDDLVQSRAVKRLVERELHAEHRAHVSIVTLIELVWVLRRSFSAGRAEVIRVLTQLLGEPRFQVQHADAAWAAVDVYERENIDFADGLIAALNRQEGCTHTVTFDRKATRIPGVVLLPN